MKNNDGNHKKYEKFIFGIKPSRKDKEKWLAHFKHAARAARAKYKDQDIATETLYERLEEIRKHQCQCGGTKFSRKYGKREAKCLACKRIASFTAQIPFFHGIKRPDIYLCMLEVLDAGCIFNSYQFAKEMKISYDTAWHLLRKVELALLLALRGEKYCTSVDSRLLLSTYIRRSTATPAFKEPSAEQQAMEEVDRSNNAQQEKGQEENEKQGKAEHQDVDYESTESKRKPGSPSKEEPSDLSVIQKRIYEATSSQPKTFELLVRSLDATATEVGSALIVLELEGLILSLPGDRYIRAEIAPAASAEPTLSENSDQTLNQVQAYINIIQTNNQGVSRKYANLHLANINRLWKQTFDPGSFSVFKICAELEDIGQTAIKAFVSSLAVDIFMPATA
jgi:hypothetical protein